jgi:hypothetical protein
MGTYLMTWEINLDHSPVDQKERGGMYEMMIAMIKQDMEKGLTKAWGNFVGEGSGFALVEGSEVDVNKMVQQYTPYVRFKTHPVISLEQVQTVTQSMTV